MEDELACPVCDKPTDEGEWCHACVVAALNEQKREDTHRMRPQVFHA